MKETMTIEEVLGSSNIILSAIEDLYDDHAEQAAKKMQDLLKQDIESPQIHNTLGCAYLMRENPYRAIKHFKKGIILNPNVLALYNNLGDAYVQKKDHENAIKAYEKAYLNGYHFALKKLISLSERIQDYEKSQHYSLVQEGLAEI